MPRQKSESALLENLSPEHLPLEQLPSPSPDDVRLIQERLTELYHRHQTIAQEQRHAELLKWAKYAP